MPPTQPSLGSLVRMFPVLLRVPRFAELGPQSAAPIDPRELRPRGFRALKSLIARLARYRPVVIFVDDAHWGDADSAVFLCELIHAAGMLPFGIIGGGDRVEIIKGDAYFQSYICHLPRSVVELGVSGRLDVLDGVLFPSICDVIRNLSGMWQLLFPSLYVKYLDVPQDFELQASF